MTLVVEEFTYLLAKFCWLAHAAVCMLSGGIESREYAAQNFSSLRASLTTRKISTMGSIREGQWDLQNEK